MHLMCWHNKPLAAALLAVKCVSSKFLAALLGIRFKKKTYFWAVDQALWPISYVEPIQMLDEITWTLRFLSTCPVLVFVPRVELFRFRGVFLEVFRREKWNSALLASVLKFRLGYFRFLIFGLFCLLNNFCRLFRFFFRRQNITDNLCLVIKWFRAGWSDWSWCHCC